MRFCSRGLILGSLLLACLQLHVAGSPPRLDGVVNLEGKPVDPLALSTNLTATVVLFVAVDCPIANRYAPEINRLRAGFQHRGVRFWLVYPDREQASETIRKHVREFNLVGAEPLRDLKRQLVKRSQARVTPEAALFNPAGELVYHGRIDDRFPALGVSRNQPSEHTLELALESLLAGRPIASKETRAIGCQIPSAR